MVLTFYELGTRHIYLCYYQFSHSLLKMTSFTAEFTILCSQEPLTVGGNVIFP